MATTTQRIQLRRDTAANWTTNNPTLQAGELGFETDTGKFKIGTGSTAWSSLGYASILPGAAAIVNADVSASAAIAGTKIAPDFGTQSVIAASLTPSAGTATKAPLVLTSGTNLTTAAAGSFEYDGTVYYATPNASNRAVVAAEHYVVLTSNHTLASQTAAQPIFDGGGGPTNGAIALPVGTFLFKCVFALTDLSATSGSYGFALGGTATKTEGWQSSARKGSGTALNDPTNALITWNTAANTALAANTTATFGVAIIEGHIRITVAGTIIPQVSLGIAAAAVVQANSYFYCKPVGGSSVVNLGNWS